MILSHVRPSGYAPMMGYLPGMWHDFGVTIGSLAGALTGLLFVAVSIKSDMLSKSVSLGSRAAQTLVLFMTSALAAIVLVAPQPGDALGITFLVTAGGGLYWLIPAAVFSLVGGVINAWLFLVGA
jgi:hypothetical protein